MRILILEENQISENGHIIPDLSDFLKNLPSQTELTLILKTHDTLYHYCLARKAVPYLKSAEFSSEYWVGERVFSKGHTLVGGIIPSLFMQEAVRLLSRHSFALKGPFLWTDLVTQAYGILSSAWTLIWQDPHLMVCHDGVLRFSRLCCLPLVQELPAILRYLKRFGYEEEMSLTLLTSTFIESLPPFIHQEIRVPNDFSLDGFTFQVPDLIFPQRLYTWPRKIRKTAYAVTLLNILGVIYFSWQIKTMTETDHILKHQISLLPTKDPTDEKKMADFAAYRHLSKAKPDPLFLIRQLIPSLKGEAVATRLHWTASPLSLTLQLELKSSTIIDQLLLTLRPQFQKHALTWQAEEADPLKGRLVIEEQALGKQER
ncbi:MAG: hypothetical protein K0R76_975 [Alphaproteobacteria bacterium]|jgi:hypothetical protein|nr:hypothetical protein [Alphaproteobacteria bacterium]